MKKLNEEQTKFVEELVNEMIRLTRDEDEALDKRDMARLHNAGLEKTEIWRQLFSKGTYNVKELE